MVPLVSDLRLDDNIIVGDIDEIEPVSTKLKKA